MPGKTLNAVLILNKCAPVSWVLCLAMLFPAGCTVGPDFVRPKPPSVERYTRGPEPAATVQAEGQLQYFKQGAAVAADWWRLFKSPQIDATVQEAIINSPGLLAAQAGLRQSQDNLRAGYGIFYPQVDLGADATRQKFSQSRFGGSGASTIFNLYTLTGTLSYALDVFGGERRKVEALGAQVDFERCQVLGTVLALSGNIVDTYIAMAAYREEVAATERLISFQTEQAGVTEAQAEAGTVPFSNVLGIRSQLASTQATLPPLKQKLSQAGHLLSTLVGRAPAEWAPPEADLSEITLPEELPLSLPSEVVRQRPDILAAEAQLHSASAGIGVATAAMYPSFTLDASYGAENKSPGKLFTKTSEIWELGAGLSAPVFHGGALWYGRQAAIDSYNQSLASYRQTVLSALGQVADTLRALENDAEALLAQSRALAAADEALALVQANYRAGTVNYLQVIIADEQYLQARIGYLQAKTQRLQDTVALYIALGGGWWNSTEKTRPTE